MLRESWELFWLPKRPRVDDSLPYPGLLGTYDPKEASIGDLF